MDNVAAIIELFENLELFESIKAMNHWELIATGTQVAVIVTNDGELTFCVHRHAAYIYICKFQPGPSFF